MTARANAPLGQTGRAGQHPGRLAVLTHALIPVDQVAPVLTGRYLVKGVIDRGALSCIFGPPNSGKTFVALDLAAHVAAGRNWHGHRVGTGGPVIYITAEGGAAFGNRIAALRATNPALVEQAAQGGMAILPVALDLCGGDDATHLLDLIEDAAEAPPVLIVIDTLARSMGEGNENDGADMGALIRAAGRVQNETGAHVMLVHHTGKNTDRGARGHSSLKAALDTELELSVSGETITLEATKQRDLTKGAPAYFRLRSIHIGTDEDGDDVFSCVIEETDPLAKRGAIAGNELRQSDAEGRAIAALRLLPTTGPFSAVDVVDALRAEGVVNGGDRKSSITMTRRLLSKLADLGRISNLGHGKFEVRA